nr:hypothetical protein KPHV_49520 [Kitasatospora purpeofusca]
MHAHLRHPARLAVALVTAAAMTTTFSPAALTAGSGLSALVSTYSC